ncbi:Phytochrome-like protein cph1 [Hartmannibacter diazotrophicus]|uniref:histidine kinase n=1 Tax=Hartmannibacter diazotrophicus TaxID=1482074 RepID=A0A2C9D7L0_9HYPH|nr:ATP-binding protein [Hartmannibacter diazotrophicus]SON56159.1 Phytochrome-like protein cph1 [Hartmannibacter diazotrophicus]
MTEAGDPDLGEPDESGTENLKTIDKRFLRVVSSAMLVAGAVLTAIVIATFYYTDRTQKLAKDAFLADEISRQVQVLLTILVDAETGQRGYLLTREASYLEPYKDAKARYQSVYKALSAEVGLLPDDSGIPNVGELNIIAEKKFGELDRTLDLAQSGRFDEAMSVLNTDVGQKLMERSRDWVEQFRVRVATFHTARAYAMGRSIEVLILLTISGAIMLLILLSGSLMLVLRHTRELEGARRAVADANTALETFNTELELRVDEKTKDLRRANDEVQRYAYIVSHDLRAPLVNIMGFTGEIETASGVIREYIERHPVDTSDPVGPDLQLAIDEDLPEAIGFIRASMTRMDSLINEILKLSRLGRRQLKPEAIAMGDLVGECILTISHQLSEIGAEIRVEGKLPDVISDRLALQQIFANLLDNALKYLDDSRPGQIVVRGFARGTRAFFEVEDNGRGISPDDRERVFELFRRSGVQNKPGEGIGLAHVRSLVRRLGGDISLDSDGRSGTKFKIEIARRLRPETQEQNG